MKKSLLLFLLATACGPGQHIFAQQGWSASMEVIINRVDYGIEEGASVSVSFNGVLQSGSSSGSSVSFSFQGPGTPTGVLSVSGSGSASDPYNPGDPLSASVFASYSGTVTPNCVRQDLMGTTGTSEVYIYLYFYPMMVIDATTIGSTCTSVTMDTKTCGYTQWSVSDDVNGTYHAIPGKTSSVLVATIDEIYNAGLATRYGRKYFKVGTGNTTSYPEAVDIWYPGPTAVLTETLKCHDGEDGTIKVDVSTVDPATIKDFVIRLYDDPDLPAISQKTLATASEGWSYTFTGLSTKVGTTFQATKNYWVQVSNQTNVGTYGSCLSEKYSKPLVNPSAISISFTPSVYNGKNLKCNGDATGTLVATPSGGSGSYAAYTWTPAVAVTSTATNSSASNLTAGTYFVKAKDSRDCWSADFSQELVAPLPLVVTTTSTGGLGGYGVSCWNKTDGQISTSVSGGVGGNSYTWSNSLATSTISGLGTGNYTVTVTDANLCQDSDSKNLTAPLPIDFTIVQILPVDCPGSNTASLEAQSVTNTIGAISYFWSATELTSSIVDKGAGTYTLRVSDGQGCSTSKSKPIADPPAFTVDIVPLSNHNGKYISCDGEDDGKIGATVLDNNGDVTTPHSYTWEREGQPTGGSVSSLDDLIKGNYKVTVTYGPGCEASDTYFLDDPAPVDPLITIPSTAIHNGSHISCPGEDDGSLHASGGGGTPATFPLPAYTYLWEDGTVGPDLTAKVAGTYKVTATDGNGCKGEKTGTLSDPAPINPTISFALTHNGLHVSCHDEDDGKLSAVTTGGSGTLSYLWSRSDTGPQLNNVAPGDYTVTVTDANACWMTSPVKTVVNPSPVVVSASVFSDYHGKDISCTGTADGWIKASATGGTNSFTYSWDTGATGADLTGKVAGTYTVTAYDLNGCNNSISETLVDPAPVVASITASSMAFPDYHGYGVSCNGANDGFIEASGQGGTEVFTFLWSPTAETSFRASGLIARNYTVTVTDENGCADTETHEITEPPVLSLSLADIQHVACHSASTGYITVLAAGGTGAHEYSRNTVDWQPDPQFIGLQAEIPYTITVRDINECTTTLTETLTQPAHLDLSFVTEPAFCADPRGKATATATGGVGTYTYQWTNAANTPIGNTNEITNKSAGVYTLLIHDDNDCPWSEPIGIITTDGPQVIVQETQITTCSYSSDGSGTLEVTGGDGPFAFLWPDGQTTIQGVDLPGGLYFVTVTDVNDCATVKDIEIPSPQVLDISAEILMPACNGDCNGRIKVQSTGGTGLHTYAWDSQTGDEANDLCAGDHSVTVTDGNSCVLTESFTLSEPEVIDVHLVSRTLPLCKSGCDGTIEVQSTGGNSGHQFVWSSGGHAALAGAICAGDHTVTVTDSRNCTVQKLFTLGEPTLLQLRVLRNEAPICHDGCNGRLEAEAFGGTGSYTYTWNNAATTASLTNICSSDYTLTATDGNACTTTETYTVGNPPALIIDLGGSVTLCVGQSHPLDAGAAWTSYNWGSNTGFSATTSAVTIKDPGQYWVKVLNAQNCEAQDTFLLETSLDLLRANFIMATEAHVGDTIVVVDVSWPLPDNITWEYPLAMKMISDMGDVLYGQFNEDGLYQVKIMARLGECFDDMTKTISVLKGEQEPGGGRLGHEAFVKEFSIYPNPTDGSFDVSVELAEESPITISVWNGITSGNIGQFSDKGKKYYLKHVDLRPMTSGPYVLRLDHKNGHQSIRFIVH
jgi:hypothetical protein